MPANRNALIRYKTIDQCLQNRYRKWTLDDLIEACSEALYEYEGIDKGVSRRSVQADIQIMRSDKLGYNAPIIVVDRKYYTYEDPNYSITQIPLSSHDLDKLSETVAFLKQFQGFSHFQELDGMVQKLEAHIYSQKTDSQLAIDFEKNEGLKGLQHLDRLYRAIIQQEALYLTYQSFKARQPASFDFSPYLLKEFRNRWFLIGAKRGEKRIFNLALDRIQAVDASSRSFHAIAHFDPATYFKDVIGVTVSPTLEPVEVLLHVSHKHAPYVLTKPLHASQREVSRDGYGVTISLTVQHNFELVKEVLAFGEGVKVLAPERLKRRVKQRMAAALDQYDTEITEKGLQLAIKKLEHKGFCILNHVYTQREVKRIKRFIDKALPDANAYGQRRLLQVMPQLKPLLLTPNLRHILQEIDPNAFLIKAIYFDKTPESNWFVSWHQDVPINVAAKVETAGYDRWTFKEGIHSVCPPVAISQNITSVRIHLDDTDAANGALRVLPGAHKQAFSHDEIQMISTNSIPYVCEVPAGGIHIMKPLLLHASSKSKSPKRRRVIHLEFASVELDGGLEWLEREDYGIQL